MADSRTRLPGSGGSSKRVLTLWAIVLLLATTQSQAQSTGIYRQQSPLIPKVEDSITKRPTKLQPGRSPPEIPFVDLDATTAKFRNTEHSSHSEDNVLDLAPAQFDAAVRAPLARIVESSGLSAL